MFLQNSLRVPRYPKISNFGYPVPKITENTALTPMPALFTFLVLILSPQSDRA